MRICSEKNKFYLCTIPSKISIQGEYMHNVHTHTKSAKLTNADILVAKPLRILQFVNVIGVGL